MREEFDFHVDMETERLMRTDSLSRAEARRRALVAFGGTERYGEEMRDGRGTAWLSGVSLDLRLGVRMLVRYPGLAIVGGLGLAVATTVATVAVGLISSMMNPAVPLPGGDRMVMLQNYDTRQQDPNQSTHLHDLETWRRSLSSVEQLGAFRTVRRNLLEEGATPELVRVAEISPSAFALTLTPPLLGRPLLSSDERAEAGNVVVIGGDAWQGRFGGIRALSGAGSVWATRSLQWSVSCPRATGSPSTTTTGFRCVSKRTRTNVAQRPRRWSSADSPRESRSRVRAPKWRASGMA